MVILLEWAKQKDGSKTFKKDPEKPVSFFFGEDAIVKFQENTTAKEIVEKK